MSGESSRRINRRLATRWLCGFERKADRFHEACLRRRRGLALQGREERCVFALMGEVGVGLDDIAALLD